MQSILVSGAGNRLVRSVSGCLVRGALACKPRWCNLGEASKGTTLDMVYSTEPLGRAFDSLPRDDLGNFSWEGRSRPETGPYSKEADEAMLRELEEHVEYLLTIKSEEQTRMLFDRWAAEYGKVYRDRHDKEHRFQIFAERLKEINKYNSERSSRTMGLNKFSDRRISELPLGGAPLDASGRDFEDAFYY